MRTKSLLIFILIFLFVFWEKNALAQETNPPAPTPTSALQSEGDRIEKFRERILPQALQESSQNPSWFEKIAGSIFEKETAKSSEEIQNALSPNTLGIEGQVQNVAGASTSAFLERAGKSTSSGEVLGIKETIQDIFSFIFSLLAGKKGGAFYIFRPQELGALGEQENSDSPVLGVSESTKTKVAVFQTEQTLLPYAFGEKMEGEKETVGDDGVPGNGVWPLPSTGGYSGSCSYGSGYCSVDNLRKYFPTDGAAQRASIICQKESSSNPFAVNKGCLTGKFVDYSIGLFQINLLAHCKGALSYTWSPPSCTIVNQGKVDACETRLYNPEENIKEAVRISNNGTNWRKPWSAARVCDIPDGDRSLEPEVRPFNVPDLLPPAQVSGCPSPSERIFIEGASYQHLKQQFNCIKPDMVVIHWSGGWNSAQGTFNALNQRNRSCQLAVDDTSIIQMLDFYPASVQKGWCAGGDFNDHSINIEITGSYFDDELGGKGAHYLELASSTNKAVETTCWLLKQYNIDKSQIYGHFQIQKGKSDPGHAYLEFFKERVNNECR